MWTRFNGVELSANIPALTLIAVLVLIAIRQVGKFKLQIWQIMLFGALVVLLTGQISFSDALKAINLDVMIFLAGMFIVGEAMQQSGYLQKLSYSFFHQAKNLDQLLLLILFGLGFLSALMLNDTLAIIGTSLMLNFAKTQKISSKLLLLSLAFAVTTGSAMSPIGNPQNLIISTNGEIVDPFLTFIRYLFLPTVVSLLITYFLLRFFYNDQFQNKPLNIIRGEISDHRLAHLSEISLIILMMMILIKILFVLSGSGEGFPLTGIAIVSALPIILFSSKRFEFMQKIDWSTLVFFAAMFVLMNSVWISGIFQSFIVSINEDSLSIPVVLVVSVLVCQLISNVPFVALCQPLLAEISTTSLMTLAAGSTIAGNLFIMGAASNVIIIQNAEKNGETLTFFEFARVGIPLTFLNIVIYWIFLSAIS